MNVAQRVSARIGQRVKFKPSLGTPGEGVVVAVSRENGKEDGESVEENQVRWDDGSLHWEMREDLFHLPNTVGDTFVFSGGMGIRPGEKPGVDPVRLLRERKLLESNNLLHASRVFGIVAPAKLKTPVSRERELTLEIRRRVANGYPLKGGCGGRKPGVAQLELAKVIATGVPIASAENPGSHSTTLRRVKTKLGWAARAAKLGPKKVIKRHSRW